MDQTNGNRVTNGDATSVRSVGTSLTPHDFETTFADHQEPIFPPELQLSDELDVQFLVIRGQRVTWYRPTQLDQLLALKSQFPEAKLVVGNTEVALEMKFKHCDYPVIQLTRIYMCLYVCWLVAKL